MTVHQRFARCFIAIGPLFPKQPDFGFDGLVILNVTFDARPADESIFPSGHEKRIRLR